MTQSSPIDPEQAARRDQVERFERVRKAHPAFVNAFKRTQALAMRGCTSRVVIVAGPTGVGKSTLGASLLKRANENSAALCEADPSLVPAVLVRATPPHGRSFNWKDFYVRTLEQLREPLIDRKVWPSQLSMFDPVLGTKHPGESHTTDALRRQVEHTFLRRKTRLWIVDEAHHMLLCSDARQLAIQFETLKSLADMCNATLVLLGTYKLLDIREHSAQLIRRSQIVHFPCYRFGQSADRAAFANVLGTFAKALPIPLAQDVKEDVPFFFARTVGCVGILRDLLRDGLDEALEIGSPEITKEILGRVAQTSKALETIIEEGAFGSLMLEDMGIDVIEDLVRKSPKEIVEQRLARMSAGGVGGEACSQERVTGKGTSGRRAAVGQRLPVRDKVGGTARVNAI